MLEVVGQGAERLQHEEDVLEGPPKEEPLAQQISVYQPQRISVQQRAEAHVSLAASVLRLDQHPAGLYAHPPRRRSPAPGWRGHSGSAVAASDTQLWREGAPRNFGRSYGRANVVTVAVMTVALVSVAVEAVAADTAHAAAGTALAVVLSSGCYRRHCRAEEKVRGCLRRLGRRSVRQACRFGRRLRADASSAARLRAVAGRGTALQASRIARRRDDAKRPEQGEPHRHVGSRRGAQVAFQELAARFVLGAKVQRLDCGGTMHLRDQMTSSQLSQPLNDRRCELLFLQGQGLPDEVRVV
mmetsp:Transcript_92769/g.261959  ORF Transcript_92769/g.261959 Transcript_92769/m.261959 type:complete len:299 (-) Transcript_92769:889-1785(-)